MGCDTPGGVRCRICSTEMSPKQRQVYDLIVLSIDGAGLVPSLAELAAEVGVSRQTVADHVRRLCAKGWLRRDYGHRRLAIIRRVSA